MTDPAPQPAPAPAVAEALSDFETFCRVASGPYADALYTSLLLLIESREAQRDAALALLAEARTEIERLRLMRETSLEALREEQGIARVAPASAGEDR